MPINYQDILGDIRQIAANAPEFQKEMDAKRAAARKLFAGQIDNQGLRDKIRKAASLSRNLRCAVPTAEAINQPFPLPPEAPERILIAVDGSQINPSRHMAVSYFLLNLGIITYPARSDRTPLAKRQSKLFSDQDPSWQGINEDKVAYMRDLEERKVISREAKIYGADAGAITLTDGPLELWLRSREGLQSVQDKEKLLEKYLDSLLELNELSATTAGYVDKPRAALVVEALEIHKLAPDDLDQIIAQKDDYHEFGGVTDGELFGSILTQPGDRSAVFELQFSEANIYKKKATELALHFFYLNVSQEAESPVLARVEIPAWVAADSEKLSGLQAALFQQCGILGEVRYPYVLHRSHEEAVVTFEDREELDRLIIAEFAREGIPVSTLSNKQTAKNLSTGKRRHSLGQRKY